MAATAAPGFEPGLLEHEGCRLRYWTRDGGRAVLLTHGAAADHRMFAAQMRSLAEAGHRVVAWDMRGHGQSQPSDRPITAEQLLRDLRALIAHLGLIDVTLVGQSLGANLAQALVRSSSAGIAGLAVIGSTWNAQPLTWWDRLLLRSAVPALRLVPASRLPSLLARSSAETEEARSGLERAFALTSKPTLLAALAAAADLLQPDPAYRTPVPLLLARGARDRTGNIARVMPVWARHEGVEEHVIDGAGHVANLDRPDEVNGLLRGFLAS